MTNKELLRDVYKNSGVTITFIAKRLDCSRKRVYSILNGAECSASEIVTLSDIFHLSKPQRDKIFLSENVN